MGASDLLRLKQRDPDAYRAELARIERQRLGASDADNVGASPPAFGLPRMRSFESLMAAFQAQASGEIGAVRAAKLSDIKRGLIYACTGLRATMLSGLPLRLYRMDAKATGRKLDLADPLSRMGKPAMVRGQRLAEAGEVTAIDSHPLLTRLARPNQDWGGRRLILATETSLCLAGEAFWHFPHNQGAKPAGIDYLAHTRVAVVKPGADDPKHRTVAGWKIDPGTSGEKSVRADEMLRLAYFDPEDPDYGALAPAAVAALGSDAYHAAMRSNSDIFAKGMRGKGLVTPPEEMESFGWEQMDEVQGRFDKHLRGTGNNHNLVVMPYRYGVQRIDVSAKDAEFLGLLEFSIEDVARAFFIPIEMVGGTRRTYQNNEAADRALWERCLGPESSWIADELTARLCPAWGLDDSYFIGFDLCDVVALQDDESLKWARDREEIAAGTKTQNEYRTEVGRDPVPWGDAWWGPPGLAPVGETVPVDDEPAEDYPEVESEDDTRAALTRAIASAMMAGESGNLRAVEFGSQRHRDILERSAKAEDPHAKAIASEVDKLFARQLDSMLAKLGERRARDGKTGGGAAGFAVADFEEAFDIRRWVVEFRKRLLPRYQAAAKAAGTLVLKEVADSVYFKDTAAPVLSAMRGRSQRAAKDINATTWDRLKATLTDGIDAGEGAEQLAARVSGVFSEDGMGWSKRAMVIARTETHGAFEETSVLAVKQAAAELDLDYEKEWVSSLDDKVRPDHQEAHGQRVGLDDDFEVGGSRGLSPGNMGDADQDVNCRCTSIYVRRGSERAIAIDARTERLV